MDNLSKATLIVEAGNMWLDPSVEGELPFYDAIVSAAAALEIDLTNEDMHDLVKLVHAYVGLRIKANQRQDNRW